MVESTNIEDFKTRCKKDKTEAHSPELSDYLNIMGIKENVSNADYDLKVKTINEGKPWKTDVFCLKSLKGYDAKNIEIIKERQSKLKQCKGENCWKHDIDGLGNIQINGEWNTCTTDANTMIDLISDLKTKNNVKVNNKANNCDIITGVPKYYRGIAQNTPITQKSNEPSTPIISAFTIQEIMKTPIDISTQPIVKNEPVNSNTVKGIVANQTTELFIPLNTVSSETKSLIRKAIKDDVFKPTNKKLVTYITEGYKDGEKISYNNELLKSCYKNGEQGFCSPVGLNTNVEELLKEQGIQLDIDDQRILPPARPFELNKTIMIDKQSYPLIIRDYQQEVIDEAIKKGHGIVEIATGGGKTVVASAIIGKLGQNTAFVVPNNSLFYNAKKQIEGYVDITKVNLGQVGGMNVDYKNDPNKVNINIISLPLASLAINSPNRIDPKKREIVLKALQEANTLVFDETHHMAADTYKLVSNYAPAKYRFGLSATPFREDNKTLDIVGGVGGTLGHRIRAKTLIDKGFLTPPEIYVVDNDDIDPKTDDDVLDNLDSPTCNINQFNNGKKTNMWVNVKEKRRLPSRYTTEKKELFRYIEKGSVECNALRNDRIIDIVKKLDQYDKTKVVFVNSVEHGKRLQEMLEKEGLNSELLTGDTESSILKSIKSNKESTKEEKEIQSEEEEEQSFNKKRSLLFEKMQNGELKTIIATDKIMGEGVDIPAIDSLVLTDMRKSKVSAIQMVGRALRKKKGKTKAIVVDFEDPVEYLEKWMQQRHEVWKSEEFPLKFITYDQIDTHLKETLGDSTINFEDRKQKDQKIIQNRNLQRTYEDLGLPDLKQVASKKGIKITGLKKQEIITKLMRT